MRPPWWGQRPYKKRNRQTARLLAPSLSHWGHREEAATRHLGGELSPDVHPAGTSILVSQPTEQWETHSSCLSPQSMAARATQMSPCLVQAQGRPGSTAATWRLILRPAPSETVTSRLHRWQLTGNMCRERELPRGLPVWLYPGYAHRGAQQGSS